MLRFLDTFVLEDFIGLNVYRDVGHMGLVERYRDDDALHALDKIRYAPARDRLWELRVNRLGSTGYCHVTEG